MRVFLEGHTVRIFVFFFYFFDFLELMEEVLVCWRWPEVWGWMWEVMVVVWTLVKVLI